MNIGVDVDGVLADLGRFMRETGAPYFKRKFGLGIVDPAQEHAEQMFGCTRKQREKFWWDCGLDYLRNEPRMDGCQEVMRRFIDAGHNVVIITSRALTTEHGPIPALLRHFLRSWLKRNEIAYSKIVFCGEDDPAAEKRAACLANSIDVMIDDNANNLLAVRDITRAVCFSAPWNKTLNDESIVRINGWSEVESEIIKVTGNS